VLLVAETNGGVISGNKRDVSKRDIAMILFFVFVFLAIPYYDMRHTFKLSQPPKKILHYFRNQEKRL
jgi:hypothetical protein